MKGHFCFDMHRQVKLVVAKCWDASPRGYFLPPRNEEPVRPIDPSAWVAHTEAVRQEGGFVGQMSSFVPSSFGLMPPLGQSSQDSSPLGSVLTSHESRMLIQCCIIGADFTGATENFAPVLTEKLGQTSRFALVPSRA